MIDWKRVSSLREEVGADDFKEVINLFLEEVEEVTDRMTVNPDPDGLAGDLHFLKGSAMNLGFKSFAEACQKGEVQCTNGAAQTVNLTGIMSVYHLSKQEFLTELPSAFDEGNEAD